jgi:hypothetical protein
MNTIDLNTFRWLVGQLFNTGVRKSDTVGRPPFAAPNVNATTKDQTAVFHSAFAEVQSQPQVASAHRPVAAAQASVQPPKTTNAPATRPTPYAGPGGQRGINQAWAFDVVTRYNPETNKILKKQYDDAMEAYRLNGNRTWVDGRGWTNQPPEPPIFLNTDYEKELAWVNSQTPGFDDTFGADTGYDLSPYTRQPAAYRMIVPQFTTANSMIYGSPATQIANGIGRPNPSVVSQGIPAVNNPFQRGVAQSPWKKG